MLNGRETRIGWARLFSAGMQSDFCGGICKRERSSLEENSSSGMEMVQELKRRVSRRDAVQGVNTRTR